MYKHATKPRRVSKPKRPLQSSPATSSNQLAGITWDTCLSERAVELPRLDEPRHFQAHAGHWLEGLSSQSAVYQRSETGNQFSNAVSACSPQPWSTPRPADTEKKANVPEHVCEPITKPDGQHKGRERPPPPQKNYLPSEAVIELWMRLMALSKWVWLSWGRLWFLITDHWWMMLMAKSDQRRTRRKRGRSGTLPAGPLSPPAATWLLMGGDVRPGVKMVGLQSTTITLGFGGAAGGEGKAHTSSSRRLDQI